MTNRAEGERVSERVMRVLVIDPDAGVRSVLADALRREGFETHEAASARAAELAFGEFTPDLVVLDVALPDGSGLDLARRLGDEGRRPRVIFLTTHGATADKVAGLAVADDYVTKPFSLTELVARARAVLRRSTRPADGILQFGDLVLNDRSHQVWRAGELIELTPREFDLLRFLMLNPRRVLTKQQILAAVWGADFQGDASTVETYVGYLRKKLDRAGLSHIHTVRGVGYALRDPRRRPR
jgi:two-component system, OmpR family, response regulator